MIKDLLTAALRLFIRRHKILARQPLERGIQTSKAGLIKDSEAFLDILLNIVSG